MGQGVGFIKEGLDSLADGGMLGDVTELLELAGFEEEVGFGDEVEVADISKAFADKA